MLLHSTRTVLAAIIWTILLHSARGAILKTAGLPGLANYSFGLYGRESSSRNSIEGNKNGTIEHKVPDVETRSHGETATRRIVTGNDMVVDARKKALEKRHIQQKRYSSPETSAISTKNEKTNGGAYPEVLKHEGSHNDPEGIVQRHSKAPSLVALPRENNILSDGNANDDDAFRSRRSNVSKAAKRIEMKNVTMPNERSSKDTPRHAEEAPNFTSTRAGKAPAIVSSNTSDAISQDRNSSLNTHGFEYDNLTNGTISRRSSSEEKRLAYRSSFVGDSWRVDRAFDDEAAASLEDQRTNDREDLSSDEPPEILSSFNTQAERVDEWATTREKQPTGNIGVSISDRKPCQEKRHRDIAAMMRGAQESSKGIFQFAKKATSTLSRRRQDPTAAPSDQAVDDYVTGSYAPEVRRTQGNFDSTASDYSVISTNLLETKANQVLSDSSADHTTATFPTHESSGKSSKGLSGLVEVPGNPSHTADYRGAKADEGWKSLSERKRLKDLSSPSTKEPYRKRGHVRILHGINYLGYEASNDDVGVSLLDRKSERSNEKTRINVKNNDGSKEISGGRSIAGEWNNPEFRRTTPASLDNGVSRRIREYPDNPGTETRVYGNVVNTGLTGLQKDREAHKTFIGLEYVDDIMPDYQKQAGQLQVQEGKKYEEKLIPDKRAMEMDGSPLGQKDEAGVSSANPLVNSTAFSSLLTKRENNLVDSIVSEIEDVVARKMESSGEEQNSRDSRKIRISGNDLTRGGVLFSKVSAETKPRSVQFLRATGTEIDASGDHDVPVGRENFILKIFQGTCTETSSSLDSSLAEVHPWDFPSDRDENAHRNDQQRGTSVIVGTPRFQARLGKNVDESPQLDDRRKIASGVIDAPEVHPGNQGYRRIQPIDDSSDNSADENSQANPTDPKTASTAVINGTNQLRNQRGQIESSIGRENYIDGSKIEGTDDISVVNRSEFLDSNKSDFPVTGRVSLSNGNEVISNANSCETCKVTENPGKEGEPGKFILADRQRISVRKMASSISDTRTSESPLRSEEKGGNGNLFDPSVFNIDDSSMAEADSKLEERESERVGRETGGKLALGQVRFTNGQPDNNLIVTGKERSSKQGSLPKIEKFGVSDERDVSTDETFDQEIKPLTTEPELPSIDKDLRSHLSELSETSDFSNNTSDISWDSENLGLHSNSQMESPSNIAGSWTSLDDEKLVGKSFTIGSMRIDSSARSNNRLSDPSESFGRQEFGEVSHMWSGGNKDIAKGVNARANQMKRGFTSRDTGSFLNAKVATTTSYHDYRATVATGASKLPDADSVDLIDDRPRTMQSWTTRFGSFGPVEASNDDQPPSSKTSTLFSTDFTLSPSGPSSSYPSTLKPFIPTFSSLNPSDIKNPNDHRDRQTARTKTAPASLADPMDVDTWTTVRSQSSHVSTSFVGDTYSSDSTPGQSESSEQSPGMPYYKMFGNAGARNPNETMQDNSTRPTATSNQWPVKHSAVVEGDLVLGGLMMVHEREDSVTCGPVMPQGGVQALEAMLYTLDWVNERDLVPGVKIGAHILDDCDKDTYGLEMAVDFIKGSISNIDGAEYHCNKTAVRKVISGVVGAASSVTSIQVANLLRLFRIPQVSFFSTSPELSNKMRFEYFTRTIPSDHYQVKAMVDIVLVMGWSYVSIIYEESNYGEKAYEELEKLLGKHQICIAVKEKLSKDSGVAEAYVYDNIVQKLLTKPRARGCIIFASDQEVAGVMKAVRRCNATGAFSWIGSDGWSARSLVSDGNEREMEGTLSVQPQANPVEGFEDYFLNLTVENNRRNPWFVEFWEDHFKCRYPNSSKTPYNNYTEECTTTERLTRENTAFEDQLQFVSDAVLAFAHAFRNMHGQFCHGKPGLCDAMKPTKGIELLNYLRTVEFDGLSGDVFHFDKNGDGPARYNIIHFKQISPGEYKWIRVGKYLEGELRLNMSEIQFRLGHPEAPESVCSLPCEVGQAKKYVEGESCCWHCFNCSQDEIRHVSDEKQCVLCPKGTLPDETHSYCRAIPEEFLRPESGWAIGAMSFSSTGILITLFVGGVFLKHNDTPIVRASGRELSYVLLTGILLCYLVTFALVLRPTDLVCSIQRFSAGFCFTVMYAALLTKTNRISRIFNAGKRSAKRPSFISPRSQLIICSMLVAVQILINAVWMVIDPAKARHHYPTREDNLLVCNSYIDASYMIAFTYPIILIVVCTVYAVLTRKIPEAFNESKHIGFTMYTTCVIWLAFVPLYFATGSHVALRITSMSVTISLSATVTIACLFTPKLYIILIHPERNVRPNMMHHRYNTTKGSVVTATNASSMMAPVTLTAVTCDQNKAVRKHAVATTDCSTQSEQFEIELKERINGKVPASMTCRSTQTSTNNNGEETRVEPSSVIKDIAIEENIVAAKGLNIGKIGNGPLSQNEVPL